MINQEELRAKYNPEGSELRNLQHELMETVMVFDRICRENNIPYMLTGGNVLGAVRHGGFIPWDDDMDVALLDKDYKRLIKVLRKLKSEKYVLQEHKSDPDYIQAFPKFRVKEGNILGSFPPRGRLYKYKGVSIDIFRISRISYYNARLSLSIHNRILSWTYKIKRPRLRHMITNVLLIVVRVLCVLCSILNLLRKKDEMHYGQCQFLTTLNFSHLLPYRRIKYEGEMLPVPNRVHEFLGLCYGEDYMELPKNINVHNKKFLGNWK